MLESLVANEPYLQCGLIDTDRYGRAVMKCFAGETDLGAALVRARLALAYRQFSSTYGAYEDSPKAYEHKIAATHHNDRKCSQTI